VQFGAERMPHVLGCNCVFHGIQQHLPLVGASCFALTGGQQPVWQPLG
jgi:hypothetical protein